MIFFCPGFGYLPYPQVRRVSPIGEEWVIVDSDGQYHRVRSLEESIVWPPVTASPGWQLVNAWPDAERPEGVRLERLPVVAWQIVRNLAQPITIAPRAEIWALAVDAAGPHMVLGGEALADESAFAVYAAGRYGRGGSGEVLGEGQKTPAPSA